MQFLEEVDSRDIFSVLKSVGNKFKVISVHHEAKNPDTCVVGRIRLLTDKTVVLDWISPVGVWDGSTVTLDIADITRIDFGGGYEEALSLSSSLRKARGFHSCHFSEVDSA